MAISPCNTLNVQTLRTSQLASLSTLSDNDLIQISEYDGSKYYSRKATVSTIATYLATVSNGHYTGSFQGNLDITSGITGSVSLSATVGASSGNYLPVKINGTVYKLQLFDES
jgi:hypothetical protein